MQTDASLEEIKQMMKEVWAMWKETDRRFKETDQKFKETDKKIRQLSELFTGQWADLTLETLAAKAADFGYDGLELACWGDHFEVSKANDDLYIEQNRKS
jgi:uncharacterized protein YecA (UPF0149 family)